MWHRLHDLLLRAYPAPFRARYGEEMREAFELLLTQAGEEGRLARARLLLRACFDTLRSGLTERLSNRGYRLGGSGVRLPARGVRVLLADLLLDLRYAVRTLRDTPGYLAGVALTLALGIGANTALFSAAWGVFGRPLPFEAGAELVQVRAVQDGGATMGVAPGVHRLSVTELEELRATPAFRELAEYHPMSFSMIGPEGPDLVSAAVVSSNYFDFLRMTPMLGRLFDPDEDHLGAHPVVVLSHEYWRAVFDGDPGAVGSTVRMNGEDHRVVGVLPPIPQFPQRHDVFLPISVCPTRSDPGFIADAEARLLTAYARLERGVTVEAARSDLAEMREAMHAARPTYAELAGGHDLRLSLLRDELVREARPIFWPLIGVAGLLLLVACANAAGLALARASRRLEALAVRSAMGAGRGRLARQLLTESTLVALLGGALGVGLAFLGSDLLATFAARFTTRAQEIRIDGVVLGFAVACSLACGLVFGVAPVAITDRLAHRVVRRVSGSRTRASRRLQRALVAVQVMVAFAVVSGAGLLLRSFWKANGVPLGFETESVITAEFVGGLDRYPDELTYRAALDSIRGRLLEDPAFVTVARVPWAPVAQTHDHRDGIWIGDDESGWHPAVADVRAVDPEYFAVLGLEPLQGRLPAAGDGAEGPRVAVVNETFYEQYMEGRAQLEELARACPPEGMCRPPATVIGVVPDARMNGPEHPVSPELFLVLEQTDWYVGALMARVAGDPERAMIALVEAVRAQDPELAVRNLGSLEQFRRAAVAPRRFLAFLLGAFAVVAFGLALAGVVGVTAVSASARTRELGIRRALGASESQAESLVVRDTLSVVTVGWAGGWVLVWGTGQLLEGLLFQVAPWDPWALGAAGFAILGAAGVASVFPARRAARADVAPTLTAP